VGQCSGPYLFRKLDQFGLSCARVKEISLDERLNAARQVRHKIYKNALVPCQGLDFGYVIAKRPPLSDFVLSPTRSFKIDEAPGQRHKNDRFAAGFNVSQRSTFLSDQHGKDQHSKDQHGKIGGLVRLLGSR